ncbi:uncharacterized protein LOC132029815 [Lycium ferocissimum]|uniref:uncharacterized protein LOC132029815 n=1 Tax=Lycium ferocissimum TaxID=112874 RepID=UPI0028160BCF|nr:uncharacterized protein LOC132029815 [Lycium ferocissimum]XP_059275170.1 uncharacterized protein LOC132029815 [Lycium ferocissimum]XP_059275171.1 uncharacterized protein LOC132029815 [Lycium ferocissimum]XP_059275172.1 uncharacterized protein LOC132029815 [Lycium ferocissimum]XP_059275173.1 uncharacterized protein LOC132029815 [Lycium ferocissimum]XP_059275174.1 uncharacterized protein LOC132029815 [Lycium ferocissimum]
MEEYEVYIDEKLDTVLGHLRKDFDGVISSGNLGPRFGVYGSFLPTYKRPTQDSCFSAQESSKFIVKHEVSMIRSLNQRTLTDLGEVSSKFREVSGDLSPTSILHTMTSFPVVGDILLSPLHEKLLTLLRNRKVFAKIDKYDHQEVRSSSVEFGGAVSLRKKDVTKVASHKPDQTRMLHTKKRKLRDHLDDNDGNAFEREVSSESGFRKQKKSKVYQTEKKECNTRVLRNQEREVQLLELYQESGILLV